MPLPNLPAAGNQEVVRVLFQVSMPDSAGTALTHIDLFAQGYNTPFDADDLQQVAGAMGTLCAAEFQACLPPTATFLQISTQSRRYPFTLPGIAFINSPGITGTVSLPSPMQATLRLQTEIANKRGRGRMQMPCVPIELADGNRLNTDGTSKYLDLCNKLELGVTLVDPNVQMLPCVSQRLVLQGDGSWSMALAEIINIIPRGLLGTQARRLSGRGI